MIGKLALDLIEHLLSKFLVTVPGGRRLAPQGAWEMLRSPAGLRGTWCQELERLCYKSEAQNSLIICFEKGKFCTKGAFISAFVLSICKVS